jgi:MFS family permease
MKFLLKETLTQEDVRKGLKYVLNDGFTSQIMVNLTSGTFLIAFALTLGASPIITGLISAIPAFCQLSQIFAVFLVEKVRKRKVITISFLLFYRISLLLIALIPFFFQSELLLFFFMVFLILRYLFSSLGQTAWTSWMNDLVPKNELGRFFGKRQFISSIFILFTSLIAANFIEFWKSNFLEYELFSYSILFLVAFLFGMISIFFISKVPEPMMKLRENKLRFSKLVLTPFKDKNYKRLLTFLICWSFGFNLITPFFTVYLLMNLKFPLTFVMVLTILSQVSNIIFFRIFGQLTDKYSNKTILKICCPLFILCTVLFSFTTIINNTIILIILLVVTYLFIGVATSGITLSTGNISLKLTPKEEGTSYLAITTIITSLSLGISPIIGGVIFDYLNPSEFKVYFNHISYFFTFNGVLFLFFIAIIIALVSIYFLLRIEETGDIKSRQLFREFIIELKNSLSNFSTTIGIRDILLIPSLYLTYRALKKQSKRE